MKRTVLGRVHIALPRPVLRLLDHHMREVIGGAAVSLAMKVLGTGLLFGFNVMLARLLGAEGAGAYFLALTVASLLAGCGRIGLANVLLRHIAINAATGNWVAVKGIYRQGILLVLAASTPLALLLWGLAPWLAVNVFAKPDLAVPLRWMAVAVAPMACVVLQGEMLKGLKRIRDSQLIEGLGVPALALLGLFLVGRSLGVNGVAAVYALATLVVASFAGCLWQWAIPQLRGVRGQFPWRELLRDNMPLFWLLWANMLMTATAPFLLGVWGTKEQVGIFSVAMRTAHLTSFILAAVSSIAAPKFAALYNQGQHDALRTTVQNTTKMITLLASPALVVLIIAPGWVMSLFGPQFQQGAAVLAILAVGQFVNVSTGPVGLLLVMCGQERAMRNTGILGAALTVALNAVLIPLGGVLGAALATALGSALKNLATAWIAYRRLGIATLPLLDKIPMK